MSRINYAKFDSLRFFATQKTSSKVITHRLSKCTTNELLIGTKAANNLLVQSRRFVSKLLFAVSRINHAKFDSLRFFATQKTSSKVITKCTTNELLIGTKAANNLLVQSRSFVSKLLFAVSRINYAKFDSLRFFATQKTSSKVITHRLSKYTSINELLIGTKAANNLLVHS